MSNSVGEKIKTVAIVFASLGIIGSIFGGIILISNEVVGIGIAVFIGGLLVSCLSFLVLYGLGQLVEDCDHLVKVADKISSSQSITPSQTPVNNSSNDQPNSSKSFANDSEKSPSAHEWKCPNCNETISSFPCKFCGYQRVVVKSGGVKKEK